MSLPTASAHDRALACAASEALPRVRIETEQGRLGTKVHQFMRRAKEAGRDEALAEVAEDATERAFVEQIPLEEFPQGGRQELSMAWDYETDGARILGTDRDYRSVRDTEYCGTADDAGTIGGVSIVGDYKTGWEVPAAKDSAQLKSLALMHTRAMGNETALVRIYKLRDDGQVFRDEAELDEFALVEHAERLRALPKRIAKAKLQVSMGETPDVVNGAHCRYCPAAPACPAKTALVRQLPADLVTMREKLSALEPSDAGRAYAWLVQAEQVVRDMKEHLRDLARIRPIPLPDGTELREVMTAAKTTIAADVAERVLREMHGDEVASAAIEVEKSITFTGLKAALRKVAKPGTLGKLEEAAREEIRKAGGLKEGSYPQVKAVKSQGESQ